MKQFIVLFSLMLLVACSPTDPTAITSQNQMNLQNPNVVGTLPDGRVLYHVAISINGYAPHDHHVYYFGTSASTVSINYNVPAGKSTRVQTIVIDGKEFQLVPK